MPLPAYDHPPVDRAAIISVVKAEHFRPGGAFVRTTTLSAVPVRFKRSGQRTNTARRQLSIERARLSSLCGAAREEIDRYASFTSGWDGYDADPITPIAIDVARTLIEALSALPAAARLTDIIPGPAPDGSLDLELRTPRRRLMITMYGSNSPDVLEVNTLRAYGDVREEKSDIEPDTLVDDLRWVMA